MSHQQPEDRPPARDRPSVLTALARVLGVTALITLLTTGVVGAVQYATSERPEAAATTGTDATPTPSVTTPDVAPLEPSAFPDGQLLTTDPASNAVLEIPSADDGWETSDPTTYVEFTEQRPGQAKPRVTGPAFSGLTDCGGDQVWDAMIGFTPPELDTDLESGHDNRVETWTYAVEQDQDFTNAEVGDAEQVELDDGSEGLLTEITFERVKPGTCKTKDVTLELLSVAFSDNVAGVAVELNESDDTPSVDDARTILATTHPRVPIE